MIQNKSVLLILSAVLISLTGSLRADEEMMAASTTPTVSAAQPTVASKPMTKTESPLRAAMKAAGDLAAAGKTDEAVAAYEKIGVQKSPKAESWRLNCEGLAYLQAKDPQADKAVPVFEKSVAADAGNALAWNNLGTAYEQTDKLDKAKAAYQKSIDAAKADGTDSAKAEDNLKMLQVKLDRIAAKNGGAKAGAAAASTTPAAGADASK